MAKRGTPILWPVREEIKRRAENGETRRSIAAELGLAKRTVDKYARTRTVSA
jgi:hypothetical protein